MTDLSQKRVKDNFDASKTILSLISDDLVGNGIKFGVVILPSKELVIEHWAIQSGVDIPENFSAKPEKDLINLYLAFFNEQSIPVIDSTPFVVKAFKKSAEMKEEFYPFMNGHPLVKGYESYSAAAKALVSLINQNGK